MEKQKIDPNQECFGVRFVWYQWPQSDSPEDNQKRFTKEAPLMVRYIERDYEAPDELVPDPKHIDHWDLFDCRDYVNAFMNCNLPRQLMDARHIELMKLTVMTSNIEIDDEGQLKIEWHSGELFIEIVKFYGEEEKKVHTLARWVVSAKSANEPYFPPWEMDRDHNKNREEERRVQGEEMVRPFPDSFELRAEIATMLEASNGTKIEPNMFKLFGVVDERGQATACLVTEPNSPFNGSQIVVFAANGSPVFEAVAKCGKPVKLKELRGFFEGKDTERAFEQFHAWFKTHNPT